MPDYSKGKIYKICSDDPDITDVYIGSSVQDLRVRLLKHIWDFKNLINDCASRKLFENYGTDTFRIELIELYPCESKKELLIREQYYMDIFQGVYNKRAHRTEEQKKEYQKQYPKDNCDKIRTYKNKWYHDNLDKARVSYEKNRPAILVRKKIYGANHKAEIAAYCKERRKIKIVCDCGCEISLADKSKHIKTNKHATLLETLQQQVQACP